MIVFEVVNEKTINYDRWILGEPFLKKYKFLFNPDKKTITFKKNEAIIINSESTSNASIKIIAIIILFFILLFIGFKIIKNYKVKSRINNINNNKKFYANMNGKYDANKISNNNISLELKDSLIFINKNNSN
jgi:preprotein translocase subunit SecG